MLIVVALQEVLQLKNAKRNLNAECRASTRRHSGFRTPDWDAASWKRRRVGDGFKAEAACNYPRRYDSHGAVSSFSLCSTAFSDSCSNPSRAPCIECGDGDVLPAGLAHALKCCDDVQKSAERSSSEENTVGHGCYVRTLLEQQKERQRRGNFRTDKHGSGAQKTGKVGVQKLHQKAMGNAGSDPRRQKPGDFCCGGAGRGTIGWAPEVRSYPVRTPALSFSGPVLLRLLIPRFRVASGLRVGCILQ